MELRSFLGLVNYYRRFIMGYSAISSPLMDILKKNQAWIRDEESSNARRTPITFESWKLNVTERKYTVQEKDMTTKLSPKQARWQDFLPEFDYQLEYKPGKANVVADALSRKAEFTAITQAQFFLQDRIKEGLEHDPLAK
nr:hypothetical protein [Tanacetum cinerariifolium]